jgi:hypothetical protein
VYSAGLGWFAHWFWSREDAGEGFGGAIIIDDPHKADEATLRHDAKER